MATVKRNTKAAALHNVLQDVAKSTKAKVTGLQIFSAARTEANASIDVLALVKEMGAKNARNHYIAGHFVTRCIKDGDPEFPATEADTVLHERALEKIKKGGKLTRKQKKAYGAARTKWSRVTADIGVRADKRGSKRGAKGPRVKVPGTDAPLNPGGETDAPMSPPKPRTFVEITDAMLALAREIDKINRETADVKGMYAVAGVVSKACASIVDIITVSRKEG